ncbi:efflux RND transporter periplasmic adaptor subunit [Aquimarina rhabdastrellae]
MYKTNAIKSKDFATAIGIKYLPLLILSISLSLNSCKKEEGNQWNQTPSYPVFKVDKKEYTGYNTYSTRLEGIQDIEIRAKVGGYIQEIFVDEGAYVKKGQILIKLEANDINQSANAAGAAIKTAEANVNTAQIEVDRLRPLVEKNIVSPVQLETAKANLLSAQAQLNQANSLYQGNVANVAYTAIKSPIDGYIGKINYRKGSLVGPADITPLTTVSNTKEIYAYFSVSEQELITLTEKFKGNSLAQNLKNIPEVKLQLANKTVYKLSGKLEASTGKINPITGAIQLRAKFNNPNRQLLSGSNGTILIPNIYTDAIAVPALSTFEIQGKKMVYVLSQGDTLKGKTIQIEDKVGRYYIVKSGLNIGDKVLGLGVSKVYPNTVIAPQLASMDSIANSFQTVFK